MLNTEQMTVMKVSESYSEYGCFTIDFIAGSSEKCMTEVGVYETEERARNVLHEIIDNIVLGTTILEVPVT